MEFATTLAFAGIGLLALIGLTAFIVTNLERRARKAKESQSDNVG